MFRKIRNVVKSDEFKAAACEVVHVAVVVLGTAVIINGIVATGSYIADQALGKPIGTTLMSRLSKE